MTSPMTQQKEEMPDVSVLIVNYNGLRFLEECLASVKTAFAKYSFEIVVVDNASQDESQRFLENRSDIRYVESKANLGFTGGNNLAAQHARGHVLLLLNNDTKVNANLDPLIDKVLQDSTGAAGARLVYGDGRVQFSVGLHHHPLRLILSWMGLEKAHSLPPVFRRIESDPTFYNLTHEKVDWVSGACLATPSKLWKQLNGLDDSFFMYCEDVDYCLRVRQAGYRVSYVADTLVTHYEGAGRPWIGEAALKRTARSYGLYLHKHHSSIVARATSFGLAIVFFLRSIAFSAQGLMQKIRSKSSAIANEKSGAYFSVGRVLIKQACYGAKFAGER